MPAADAIASYRDLWHVEASFQMSTSDLAARPMFARTVIRNFIQWRARAGIAPRFKTRYRVARTTPLGSTRQPLGLIKDVIGAEHVILSTRIAALLLLLLFGTPLKRICELTIDDIATTPT